MLTSLRKGVAVVLIAMGLSVTLVVTTPQNAQAFAPAPVIAGPVLLGGASGAAGAVTVSGLAAAAVPVLVVAGVAVGGYFLYQYADSKIDFPWEDNPYSKTEMQGEAVTSQATRDLVYENIGTTRTRSGSFASDKQILVQIAYTPQGTSRTIRPIVAVQRTCRPDSNYSTSAYIRSRALFDVGTISVTDTVTAVQRVAVYVGCPTGQQLLQATVSPPTWDDVKANPYPNQNLAPRFSWYWESPNYDDSGSSKEYETKVTCKGNDGTLTTISEKADALAGQVPVPSCAARGVGRATKSVSNFLDGGVITGPPLLDIMEGDTAYTECDPAAGGRICKTEIYVDGQPCVVGAPACESWAGLNKANPGRVTCRYGGKLVHMSACSILEGAYLLGGSPMTKNNVDGDPATWDPRRGVPGWVPNVYGPEGSPVPDTEHPDDPEYDRNPEVDPAPDITTDPRPEPGTPQPSPSPSTSTQPTTSPSSSPGPSTNPDAPVAPKPEPPANPEGEASPENCLSAAVTWNPIDWVMVPVKCALTWAFVPTQPSIDTATKLLKPKIEEKGIAPLIGSVEVVTAALPGETGCLGPAVNLDKLGAGTWHPFQACTGPMQTGAMIVKALLSLVLVLGGSMTVIRAAGAAFGYSVAGGKDVDV